MTLVPLDPFRKLIALQNRMNSLFDETVAGNREVEFERAGTWAPPVDIRENEEEIVLTAELPGMDLADVDIQVHDNSLTLKGERKMEKSDKGDNYHRVERVYGTFVRAFTLPGTVDKENISASYDRGVLEIKMPKTAKSKPTQIKIDVKS